MDWPGMSNRGKTPFLRTAARSLCKSTGRPGGAMELEVIPGLLWQGSG